MQKLVDKIAVITGGTSGMGLATAKLFAQEGAYVFITARKQQELDEAEKTIGANVTAVKCDSSNLADLDRLYAQVRAEKGHVDIIFANAGAAQTSGIENVTEDEFDQQFNVNVKGTLFTVQKGLPLMRDHGSIIMTGSLAGLKAIPDLSVYSASKAALDAFARCWTSDLKDRRIRVNVIHPGSIDTPSFNKSPAKQKEIYLSHIPLGRFGKPGEIAATALFLASEDSGFITGTSLIVDGGAHI